MSTIEVRQAHSFPIADARSKVASFDEMLGKYGARLEWKGNTAEIKGTGVSGDVKVDDKQVAITIKLGLLARAVVDPVRLEASIKRRLGEAFGPPPSAS